MTLLFPGSTPEPSQESVQQAAAAFGCDGAGISRCSGGHSGAIVWHAQPPVEERDLLANQIEKQQESSLPERAFPGFSAGSEAPDGTAQNGLSLAIRAIRAAQAPSANRRTALRTFQQWLRFRGLSCLAKPVRVRPGMETVSLFPAGRVDLQAEIPIDCHFEIVLPSDPDWIWQAEEWKPGQPAMRGISARQQQSGFQALADLYRHSRVWSSPDEWFQVRRGPSPGLTRRLAMLRELEDRHLESLSRLRKSSQSEFWHLAGRAIRVVERWLPTLRLLLEPLERRDFQLQPVIRDLWKTSFLFTGDTLSGLIDLGASGTDHVCLDLSRLLRSWHAHEVDRIPSALREFASLSPLHPHELELFSALDAASAILTPVTWVRRGVAADSRFTESAPLSQNDVRRMRETVEIAEDFQLIRV